jgi:hypothetical protein
VNEPVRIYVAGPYTRPDPVANTHNACRAWKALRDAGFAPYCPHWTMLQQLVTPVADVGYWYDADLPWVAACDALYRLPGASAGADREAARMRELGRPVFEAGDRGIFGFGLSHGLWTRDLGVEGIGSVISVPAGLLALEDSYRRTPVVVLGDAGPAGEAPAMPAS